MLATAGELPRGNGWAYEYKWDGMRALARLTSGDVRLFGRSGRDITERFPELESMATGITDATLDGEIIAFDDSGLPSFSQLTQRIHITNSKLARQLSRSIPVSYLVFDLLAWNGQDLRPLPYHRRRALLDNLAPGGKRWFVTPGLDDGDAALRSALDNGLEGVVAKRLDSPYRAGRSHEWVKVKMTHTTDLVVGGWRRMTRELGSLLVGEPSGDGRLEYRGRVGGGLSDPDQGQLLDLLRPLKTPESPFTQPLDAADMRGATWVTPRIVIEVEYGHITEAGRLRFPRFVRYRPDKSPGEL